MKTVTMVLWSILWLGTHVASQGVTADEYPSEDELLSALQRGEIDDLQYERLREILCLIDADLTAETLDEIPDIDHVLELFGLSRDELVPPVTPVLPRPEPTARVRHRYQQKATEQGDTRYRTSLDLYPTNNLTANLRIDRTYSGCERIVGRSVRYRKRTGTVREVTLGTHARRLGLGTVAGYRGQLFDCKERIDAESFRFPDYGGANGGYLRLVRGGWDLGVSGTIQRDRSVRLVGGAAMVKRAVGDFAVALLFGAVRLTNRISGAGLTDLKPAVFIRHRYRSGRVTGEFAAQQGDRKGFGAAVVEGEHRHENTVLRYDLWAYGKSFLDLIAGSRSGPLSRRDTIETVAFGFRTRRRGAHGGRLRTTVGFAESLDLENDLLIHTLNADTLRLDYAVALERHSGASIATRLEYRYRYTRRASGPADDGLREGRGLAQINFIRGQSRGLAYLGHTTRENQPDYLSLLAKVRFETDRLGRIELWANLARVSLRPVRNDYCSVYARTAQVLTTNVSWAVKLSHRYSRSSGEKHETTITLEVEGVL